MKAQEINLEEFLSKADTQFIIPVYQRNYDWNKQHCEQLLLDIIEVGRKEVPHFIGSIVFIHDGIYTSGVKELIIIDGQQRLTTITLIFVALYHKAKENGNDFLANKLYKKYLINEFADNDQRLKLKPTENNDRDLKTIINNEKFDIDQRYSNLLNNYTFFQKKFSEIDIDLILRGLSQLMFVEISLDRNHDSPQRIFESLNSTGLDLSQADLIRNYILMDLSFEQQKIIFTNYWEFIEKWTRDGACNKLSDFIRDFLTMKTGNIPNKSEVYAHFKKTFSFSDDSNLEDTLLEIKELVVHYGKLINPEKEKDLDIRQQLKNINTLEINTSYPFLMKVYDDYENQIIDKDCFVRILRFIQTFTFRRFILDLPTNTLNKIFMNLYDKIDIKNYETSLYTYILKRTGKQRIPNDAEIREALKDKDIYNARSKNRLYLLEDLENFQNREFVSISNNNNITIEHIFPQQPDDRWKLDISSEEYRDFSEKFLHTLGNLTLSGNNGKLGNKPFLEKKELNIDDKQQGYRYRRLWLNQFLKDIDCWNIINYQKRTELLINRFLKIWSLPDIAIDNEFSEEINIYDAEDPTNRRLEYAIFFGRKVANTNQGLSMASLYHYVIKSLFEMQPDVFLMDLKDDIKISTHSDKLRNPKAIDDTYFLETSFSSQDIFNKLRLILTTLGLEDELFVKFKAEI